MTSIKNAFYWVVGGVGAVLALLVWFFKSKADKAESDALLADTKGQDKQLKKQQDEVKKEIDKVKNQDDSKLTDEDRANRWNN